MDTNEHELILKEEVFDVVGCAMWVLNESDMAMRRMK